MKRKIRKFYQAVIAELTEHKNTFFVYLGLRLLVLGILILQIFHQNYENAFLCILTLILMITPCRRTPLFFVTSRNTISYPVPKSSFNALHTLSPNCSNLILSSLSILSGLYELICHIKRQWILCSFHCLIGF